MNSERLLQIRQEALEAIDQLKRSPYRAALDDELQKYQAFFEGIVSYFQEQWAQKNRLNGESDKEKLYNRLKHFLRANGIVKLIHFGDHAAYENPTLYVLQNVLAGSLRFLAAVLHTYSERKREFTDGPQRAWIDSYDERIHFALRDFSRDLPCMEAYNTSLQTLLDELQKGPPTEKEMLPSIVKTKMAKTNFQSDGGFSRIVTMPIFKDYQLIGLTLAAFKKSLCGAINNCEDDETGNQLAIQAAFNEDNYKLFLEVIEFYNNPRYGTENIKTYADLFALYDKYKLGLPSPEEWSSPHCCQKDLERALRGNEGGRRKQFYNRRKIIKKTRRRK
jgi:hypothetical protein